MSTMMTRGSILWWIALYGCFHFVSGEATDETCDAQNPTSDCEDVEKLDPSKRNPGPLECSLYMAPSTLGVANMGMYSGINMVKDQEVNYPEIVVPLLFREWGEHTEGYIDGELWSRYIWEGYVTGLETYKDTDKNDNKAGFIPGIGCTINGLMDGRNMESTHDSLYDTAGLHRSKDPGSGAFTPYHSSNTTALMDIAAGQELFASYGMDWIPEIPGAQITLNEEMDEADDFMRNIFYDFVKEQAMEDSLKEALWNFTREFPVYNQGLTNLPRLHTWADIEKMIETIEEAPIDLKSENKTGENSVSRYFIYKEHRRSMDWLQNHPNSYCQDHIQPKISTIPQAGRGAFATRFLPKGSVVGYAPLIHIGKEGREILHIQYDHVFGKSKRHAYDLIINYSFFHNNSTMILTPYGGMVNYINHATYDTEFKPNVQVRFPDKELIAHKPEWLDKDPEFFHHAVEKIGLSFEYVALRDIEEGEEVLLDYGPEWDAAWKEYLKNWKPEDPLASAYKHSSEFADQPYFQTTQELEENPYPHSLHTMCIASYGYDEENEQYHFVPVMDEGITTRWHCHVVERFAVDQEDGEEEKDEFKYTIQIFVSKDSDDDDEDSEWITVHEYDPSAIFLVDKAFSTDWHLPNAFRHPIAIPDAIMPKAWQNGPDPFEFPEIEEDEEEYEDEGDLEEGISEEL